TGKRLPQRVSEIIVAFREIPHSIFTVESGKISRTRLAIRLQPDEGIKLWLMLKEPGAGGMRLQHVPLDMSFAKTFSIYAPEAYERLLMDVIRGNATLFMRRATRSRRRGAGSIRSARPGTKWINRRGPILPALGGPP